MSKQKFSLIQEVHNDELPLPYMHALSTENFLIPSILRWQVI